MDILNNGLQIIIFFLTANIPSFVTGRMSYVNIAWPWGLIMMGSCPFYLISWIFCWKIADSISTIFVLADELGESRNK